MEHLNKRIPGCSVVDYSGKLIDEKRLEKPTNSQ